MVTKKEIFAYQTDASRLIGEASKVVFPSTIEEVQTLVKNSDTTIVPRGAGTNFVGGCIPNNSLIMDLNKLNKVKEFSPKGTVYVEAGVTLKELNQKLEPLGFEFPIQPLNQGVSTIGGMIATNASGSRAMKYGQMKDWIDAIDFVNGRGEIMKTSKADLMDICGMEGITGIIVGAKLRIIPLIKRSASLFQSDDLEEIMSISRRLKLEKDVCSLDLISKQISQLINFPEKYNLIIEFDSERGKIKDDDYQKIINLRDKLFFTMAKNEYVNSEDPKLFLDKIKEFVLYLEANKIPYFSNVGFGIVHPFFKDTEQNKRNDIRELMKKTDVKLGNYGIGITRKEFVETFTEKIIHRVKLRNDPFGKLNNGKIINIEHLPNFRARQAPKTITGEDLSAKRMIKELSEPVKTPTEIKSPQIIKQDISPSQKMTELIKKTEKEEVKKSEPEMLEKPLENKRPPMSKEEQDAINKVFGKGFGVKPKEPKNDN